RMTYNVPTVNGWYRYMGVSVVDSNNGIQSLIGLPASSTSLVSGNSGLCDYYWVSIIEAATYGIHSGGAADTAEYAGIFSYYVGNYITLTNPSVGLRSMLIT
ncbi:MAG: hypothetical protein IKC79_01475, partial [Clostridia bacterium]|nr:hypothetical protein [Clostridia bacterium]